MDTAKMPSLGGRSGINDQFTGTPDLKDVLLFLYGGKQNIDAVPYKAPEGFQLVAVDCCEASLGSHIEMQAPF